MSVEKIPILLEGVGSLMIGYTVIQVHYRFWKEHKVDERVFREMNRERKIGIIGIFIMVLGFVLQLI